MSELFNLTEYIRGWNHCRDGKPHKENQHPDYDRGYRVCYEAEQVMTEVSIRYGYDRTKTRA